ncbi:MAG: aconitase X catalytic domain-containing protein [Pseudomonadota bacterium]
MTSAPETLALSDQDKAHLSGDNGPVLRFAAQMVVKAGELMSATELIDVSFVHVDACHYYGEAHVDFARFVVDGGGRMVVPSWTNTVPVSVELPDMRPPEKSPQFISGAKELMKLYEQMGCRAVWTCAPYQLPGGPGLGDHIVGSESNAVTYYNSAVGARTNKYGDFLDVCCALMGRVPNAGLHKKKNRKGQILFRLGDDVPQALRSQEMLAHVLGHHVGKQAGSAIPVIEGLPPDTTLDSQKAMSAATAASGGVALFHAVGVTPEAPDLETAFQGEEAKDVRTISLTDLRGARDDLSTAAPGRLDMVALGTPHFSFTEFARLAALMDGRKVADGLVMYVSTSRHVRELAARKGWVSALERAGVQIVVDTCTYFTPAVRGATGRVMTNSAKWAYYAPGMLPVEVCFGSLEDCVQSATSGDVERDERLWQKGAA